MSDDPLTLVTDDELAAYCRDGAVCLRGLFRGWVEPLAAGIERNIAEPGPMAQHYTDQSEPGQYFGDYCNWRRIPEFGDFVFRSPAAAIAARLMGATRVQFFHEHVLVKEPGTTELTPWHHDQPYYVVEGRQAASLWLALDPVPREVCPEFVAGSHDWGRLFYPRTFKDGVDYDYAGEAYESLPDIEAERDRYELLAWALEPGDAVAFHFMTVHNGPANPTGERRRAFVSRWLGDDVCYADRPGTPSPPYPEMGIGLRPGDPMRRDWFPVVWPPEERDQETS